MLQRVLLQETTEERAVSHPPSLRRAPQPSGAVTLLNEKRSPVEIVEQIIGTLRANYRSEVGDSLKLEYGLALPDGVWNVWLKALTPEGEISVRVKYCLLLNGLSRAIVDFYFEVEEWRRHRYGPLVDRGQQRSTGSSTEYLGRCPVHETLSARRWTERAA